MKGSEADLPEDCEWALGCWFDGLWYPVALGRRDGERRMALFANRGYAWLESNCVAPIDVRVGALAMIFELIPRLERTDEKEWRYAPARLLTWEPDYRNTVVEFADGSREVVTRWSICFQRPVRPYWKPKDRVWECRGEAFYFPLPSCSQGKMSKSRWTMALLCASLFD